MEQAPATEVIIKESIAGIPASPAELGSAEANGRGCDSQLSDGEAVLSKPKPVRETHRVITDKICSLPRSNVRYFMDSKGWRKIK